MSISILRRLKPFVAGRIQQNSKLLSSSAAIEASSSSTSSSSTEAQESFHMTENCIKASQKLVINSGSSYFYSR